MDTYTIIAGLLIYTVMIVLITSLFKYSRPEVIQNKEERRSNDRRKNPASRRTPERDVLCGDRRQADRRMMMSMASA